MKSLSLWIGSATLIWGLVAIPSETSGTTDEGRMPDLDGSVVWLNSIPLSSKMLAFGQLRFAEPAHRPEQRLAPGPCWV